MADTIERLRPEDFDQLLAHLSRCFQKAPDDGFDRFLAGVYDKNPEKIGHNLAIRRDGRLAAVVGLFPIRWRVGGDLLVMGGIGGVSVAPEFRGQGLMQRLMRHAVETMRGDGTPLSFLAGQRQRYGYFGYEICGNRQEFTITPASLRHTVGSGSHALTAGKPAEDDFPTLHRLQATQPAYCERRAEDFQRFVGQWHSRCHVLHRGAEIAGYGVVGADGRLHELVLTDVADTAEALRAVLSALEAERLQVVVQPTDPRLAAAVERVSQATTGLAGGNWLVFDWPRVLTALLRARLQTLGPCDGEAVLGIGGQTLALRAAGDDAICEPTPRPPTLSLDEPEAMRLLFGPLPPTFARSLPRDAADLARWCPLPLSIGRPDHV